MRFVKFNIWSSGLLGLLLMVGCGGGGNSSGGNTNGGGTGTVTSTLASTIATGKGPGDVLVNNKTKTEYIADQGSGQLTVVNLTTKKVIATLQMTTVNPSNSPFPVSIAINRKTNVVYVANFTGSTITVVDGALNKVTASIDLSALGNPEGVAVNSVTNQIFVITYTQGAAKVGIYNGATNALVASISLPNILTNSDQFKASMVVNQATNKVYIALFTDNHIVSVDGAAHTAKVYTTSATVQQLSIDHATNNLYVFLSQLLNRTATTRDSVIEYVSGIEPSEMPRPGTELGAGTHSFNLPVGFQMFGAVNPYSTTTSTDVFMIAEDDQSKFHLIGVLPDLSATKTLGIVNFPPFLLGGYNFEFDCDDEDDEGDSELDFTIFDPSVSLDDFVDYVMSLPDDFPRKRSAIAPKR